MTSLPPPEQWVLSKMSEVEVAEMIEEHIDYYTEDKDGNRRSVHLPTPFVRHFMRRHDGVLPTVVAIATAPIVLADGGLLAPDGLDRDRGIQFLIRDELRAVIPQGQDCTPERVKAAMEFLCDEWLVDVATDYVGKATIIAAALTLIERSLLPDRPCFFVTAGRRGGGKTTTLTMLIMAVTGLRPAAAAWSTNEEERRKALMSYFLYGVAYILWDNIARGTADLVPAHREVLHLRVLFRPQARRERNGLHRRFNHPLLHRQQRRSEGRPGFAQPPHPPRRGPRRPREPAVQTPGPGWMDGEPPRRDPGGALHHPVRQPAAQSGARCRRQGRDSRCGGDWLARRSRMPPSSPGRSSTSRNCSSRKRRTTRNRHRSPTCLRFW